MARGDFRATLLAIKTALLSRAAETHASDVPAPTLVRAEAPAALRAPRAPPAPPPKRAPGKRSRQTKKVRPPQRANLTRGDPAEFSEFRINKGPAPVAPTPGPAGLKGQEALRFVREQVPARSIRVFPGPPPALDLDAQNEIARAIAVGASLLCERPTPDEAGFIVGFDFGTSSSKVVVHQLSAGDPTYALSVPEALRTTDGHEAQTHLWRSTVWHHPATELFTLWPAPGAIAVEGFKTGLIQSSGHRMEAAAVTHTQAAAAYLALMIAHVLGAHRAAAPAGFDKAQQYGRFHFGLPVACKEDASCVDDFRRVLHAAFRLAAGAGSLDLASVRAALEAIDPMQPTTSDTPFLVFEELAAVIAGYRQSENRRSGPHMVVDVGASTLDVATFYIPESEGPVPVYMSGVELLGAEALSAARRADVPDPTFRQACIAHTRHIFSNTYLTKNAQFFPNNDIPKPLLLVGGGRRTDLHQPLYETWREGLGGPINTPLPGPHVRYDYATDFARLLLAWGLAQEEPQLPILRPPSEVEAEVRSERDWQSRYIDKDMV